MLNASKKRLFLVHGKIFHLVDPFRHRDVFSKELPGEFCQLQPISGRNVFGLSAVITD